MAVETLKRRDFRTEVLYFQNGKTFEINYNLRQHFRQSGNQKLYSDSCKKVIKRKIKDES